MINWAPQRALNAAMREKLQHRELLPFIRAANQAQREWTKVCNRKDLQRARSKFVPEKQELEAVFPAPYLVNLPALQNAA